MLVFPHPIQTMNFTLRNNSMVFIFRDKLISGTVWWIQNYHSVAADQESKLTLSRLNFF
jgi:hypothetical protein